jgi:hypothetical protein
VPKTRQNARARLGSANQAPQSAQPDAGSNNLEMDEKSKHDGRERVAS